MGTFQVNGLLKIGSKLRFWTDTEGANIRFYTPSDDNNIYELDTNGNQLRLYYCTDGGSGQTGWQAWYFGTDGSLTAKSFIGALKGNADTATKLATARTISLTGSVTGSGSFDGSGNLSITTTTNHTHSYLPLSGGTLTGALNVGNSLRLWSDDEGGNIRITSGNNHTNYWEMDSYNGNLRLYTWRESDGTYIGTTLEQETGYWSTAYRSIRTSYDGGNVLYAGSSNEVNFGGTSGASTIYFGYRALDSKPIPTNFIFGGANGSAALTAQNLSNSGRSVYWINGRDSALVKFTSYSGYNAITSMKTTNGSWEMGVYANDIMYFNYASDTNYSAGTNSTIQVSINSSGYLSAPRVYGAVWNDYAEYRICNEDFKPGQVVCENNNDTLSIAKERLQPGANIVSDTFGFAIGETDEAKCPIAVSGRVLVYTYEPREEFQAGDAVCAAPNGTVSRMTREEIIQYPERIIGTVSSVPSYDTWGTGNVKVDNRIWIKVK